MAQVFQAYFFVVIAVMFMMCATVPYSVMALDLSRLYGHTQVKRNGESLNTINSLHQLHHQLHSCFTALERQQCTSFIPSNYQNTI